MINKGGTIFANLRLNAKGKKQLQQCISVFFRIRNVTEIQFHCCFTQLRLSADSGSISR